MALSDEQSRALINASQLYESWKDAAVELSKLPGGMYWRVINSKQYLYQYVRSPAGIQLTKSLGPRTPEAEQTFRDFKTTKESLEERKSGIEGRFKELGPAWRALRLPAIDRTAGRVLRAFDVMGFLGGRLLVIGTYALKAYEVEAATNFAAGMDATEDLDFTLLVDNDPAQEDLPRQCLLTLRQIDSTFIVAPGTPQAAVNKRGYRVDLLAGRKGEATVRRSRPWKPEVLEGQDWLLRGKPVSAVLIDFDGWPVRLAAPDPRYFALHKLWLSERQARPALKRTKDRRQGRAALQAIVAHLPHYPLDSEFAATLPAALKPHLQRSQDPGHFASE